MEPIPEDPAAEFGTFATPTRAGARTPSTVLPTPSPSPGERRTFNLQERLSDNSARFQSAAGSSQRASQTGDRSNRQWTASLFNLTNTAIGAGTLALPYTLHQCGLVLGLALIILVGILSWYGLYFLTVSSLLLKQRSFIGVAKGAFGSRGEMLASLILFILLIGPLAAYFNIIGNYVHSVSLALSGPNNRPPLEPWAYMLIFGSGLMLPLSLIRSMRSIAPASFVALMSMFYILLLIPFSYLRALFTDGWQPPNLHLVRWNMSILSGFATIGMAYINHAVVVECLNDLPAESGSLQQEHSLTSWSSSAVTFIYLVVSVSGYLHYGDRITGNILNSESSTAVEMLVARMSVAVGIALTYPLVIAPARGCLDRVLSVLLTTVTAANDNSDDDNGGEFNGATIATGEDVQTVLTVNYNHAGRGVDEDNDDLTEELSLSDGSSSMSPAASLMIPPTSAGVIKLTTRLRRWWIANARIRFYGETVLIFALSLAIAVLIPGLDKILALFGAMTGSFIVYILPAMYYMRACYRLRWTQWDGWRKFTARPTLLSPIPTAQRLPLISPNDAAEDILGEYYGGDSDYLNAVSPLLRRQSAMHLNDAEVAALFPTQRTLLAVYVNLTVGILLFLVGTGYALADLFLKDD